MPIYLDNNATTQADPRVVEAMLPYLQGPFANPSSLHRFGRAARDAVEEARAKVARLVDVQPAEVLFTSGGTEANNLALSGALPDNGRLLVGATEHSAVLEPAEQLRRRGVPVIELPVDDQGRLQMAALSEALASDSTNNAATLVSVMAANNETGVLQDLPAISQLTAAAGAILHSDAVQAVGKLPFSMAQTGVQLATLSAHKIHGPKGVGALLCSRSVTLRPQIVGGGQERGLRGGTENVAAIVGFGVAADLAADEMAQRIESTAALRDRLEAGLRNMDAIRLFSVNAERLPNTLQFAVAGFDGEALVMALDRRGIAVSSGSACHSSNADASHVLLAMGIAADIARGAVRVSFCKDNSEADVDQLLQVLADVLRDRGVDAPGVMQVGR